MSYNILEADLAIVSSKLLKYNNYRGFLDRGGFPLTIKIKFP